MARKVFFSFHYDRDSWRVSKVRNSNVVSQYEKNPYYDKAAWETIKRNGPDAVKRWINTQLSGTSVTVVLIGLETASRPWVKYEIAESIRLGKGILGIDISKIRNHLDETDATGANPLPSSYPLYRWNNDDGQHQLGNWIEKAARAAGR